MAEIDTTQLQGIFLDFYGTLVGGDRQAVEAVCQAVIDAHGLELAAPELARQWGHAYFDAIESLNGDGFKCLGEIEHDTLVQTLEPLVGAVDVLPYLVPFQAYLAGPPLFDEVRDVLADCRLPICIVSNADEYDLRTALASHDLAFEHIVTSELARSYKPAPGIFEHALKITGFTAERVLHVGDSLHSDVGGAQPLGLRTAWVCREGRISDIGTARPDLTWPDLWPMKDL